MTLSMLSQNYVKDILLILRSSENIWTLMYVQYMPIYRISGYKYIHAI